MLLVLAIGLCGSAAPSDAWAAYGFGGIHGGVHGYGGLRVTIGIRPFWGLYGGWAPYAYPPVVAPAPVVVPSAPSVVVPPVAPTPSWYYSDHPRGYDPYVSQCPGGWRPVPPTPAP